MSSRTLALNDAIYEYLLGVSSRESELLRRLREETARDATANMQISPEQGQLLALLVRLLGAERAIEVGTYTGYSSIWIAGALPGSGELLCCDVSEAWTTVARRYWLEAGLAHKIRLALAPALSTLDGLLAEGRAGQFDFAFIDADKENYTAYYQRCYQLLRPGGLLAVDNTLWNGSVAGTEPGDAATESIRAFNRAAFEDPRVDLSLVPIGDGLTLLRKREPQAPAEGGRK